MSKRITKPQTIDKPEDRLHSPMAPTLHAFESDGPQPSPPVEQTRKKTGCAVIAVLSLGMAVSGTVGTLGYLYATKQAPFAPKEVAATPSSSAAEKAGQNPDHPGMPEVIYTNQDLREALLAANIKATDEDFNFDTGRTELQAKALYMTPQGETDDAGGKQYKWQPARERIIRADRDELLVAVKIINPYIQKTASSRFVSEGLPYRAWTVDAEDSSIIYFYLNGADIQGENADSLDRETAQLAQIAISNPVKPKQLLWARSFRVAKRK